MISLFLSTSRFDPLSIAIRYGTHSPWSHAGFFDHDRKLTFSAMLSGGVKWRKASADSYLYLMSPNTDKALDWALTQQGKPYDWKAIAGFLTDRDWNDPAKWFCSELVAAAQEKIGSPIFNRLIHPDLIVPGDILLSPLVAPFSSLS